MSAISGESGVSPALERFFDVLVETIRDAKPGYISRSFTVAEIYQSLIPYRTHRDRLGVEMNGDYEDVLLRLLAGEGEFLQMESEQARGRIQKELRRKNPNTGVYREFAAAEVRLNPARVEKAVNGARETVDEREPARAVVPEAAPPPSPPRPSDAPVRGRPNACPTCGEGLPDRETLKFCPYCGKNTRLVPCRSCGEELDRSWRFCVACGEPTG